MCSASHLLHKPDFDDDYGDGDGGDGAGGVDDGDGGGGGDGDNGDHNIDENLDSLLCHLGLPVFNCIHLFPIQQDPVVNNVDNNDQAEKITVTLQCRVWRMIIF